MFGSGEIIQVRGLKRDPGGTALVHRALASPLQRGRVAIETEDAASRTNDVGHEERNISNSGAQIQNRMPGEIPAERKNFSV